MAQYQSESSSQDQQATNVGSPTPAPKSKGGSGKKNPQRDRAIDLDYARGLTLKELRIKYGVSEPSIYGALKRVGAKPSRVKRKAKANTPKAQGTDRRVLDQRKINAMRTMWDLGTSKTRISKVVGVSIQTVSKYIDRFEQETRMFKTREVKVQEPSLMQRIIAWFR